ncbi:hypothetical protein PT974_04446 [Cladobotryum mycophilum]|uniref:Peptidase S8/S53 domain-containing protein n=1 Tax=Cladobotryum mycophilum TaxID=491253 RepID=A0ABR0SV47_9HYPO
MDWNQEHFDLFFTTVSAFQHACPPAPDRGNPAVGVDVMVLHNLATELNVEVKRLHHVFPKDFLEYELQYDDCTKVAAALEDVLDVLDNLVDNSICDSSSGQLCRLKTLQHIIGSNSPTSFDGSEQIPQEALQYIRYIRPGGNEAAQYRRLVRELTHFNSTMDSIYLSHSASFEDTVGDVFYRDRSDSGSHLEEEKEDLTEVYAAKRICDTTKAIARVMSSSACRKPHSFWIHLSGFQAAEEDGCTDQMQQTVVDSMMQLCGPNVWRAIQWSHWGNENCRRPPDDTICEMSRGHQAKRALRIRVHPVGLWECLSFERRDRLATVPKPPTKSLDSLLIPNENENEARELKKSERLALAVTLTRSLFNLIGSPLLQDPWTSDTMACSEMVRDQPIKLYISSGLVPSDASTGNDPTRSMKSFLIYLGALLWELFWQRIEVTEEDEEPEDEDGTLSLFNALCREESKKREKFVDTACLNIVNNCIDAYYGDKDDDESIRASIYRTILKPLEKMSQGHLKKTKKHLAPKAKSTSIPTPQLPYSPRLSRPAQADSPLTETKIIRQVTKINHYAVKPSPTDASFLASSPLVTNSTAWLEKFDQTRNRLQCMARNSFLESVRIAILDTGCDINDQYFSGPGIDHVDDLEDRWYDCTGESAEPIDEDRGRHGTALACLLLRLASEATIYIIRVAKDAAGLAGAAGHVQEGILHAVTKWDVDIISMSFGFNRQIAPICDAITEAEQLKQGKILFFAAANNDGLNQPELFPAFLESTISVRGTNYDGSFIGKYDPVAWTHKPGVQYGTLAQDVPCTWPEMRLKKSGCSIAAPIMAATAAAIIQLAQNDKIERRKQDLIRTRRGMMAVFSIMSEGQSTNSDRRYIAPWQLMDRGQDPLTSIAYALDKTPM